MLQCLFTDPESCLFWLCPNTKDWANNLNHGVKNIPTRLDVSLIVRDSREFLGAFGDFFDFGHLNTLGTFQHAALGTNNQKEFSWHHASYRM